MSTEPFSAVVPVVIDPSAWARQSQPKVINRWKATARAGLLVSCPMATLEILGSARDEEEYALADFSLGALPQAPVTASVCRAALAAMRELGARRRLPAPDYLIAAAAAERGFGVLHSDRHFDLLATVLPFESVRLPG
ncbi:MAG: PIN domain-containing protein [Solirubrobacterales bacterium]